ncbi:LCCL domain-containing protein [Sphingosinicella sp. LHD-64]|uniref:LCCL domain-containing protein n=1 Tax=Sphingosinicella sp. LHD-64 TaxID=3072139 RepID=UPI00280EFED6|nr:LCCL domain-containing protein [Sphingosinicella sp. LHD-64]MDQ8755992.1 LCCL domain-containing protein [Sphingosinicella sp. LHD-64]
MLREAIVAMSTVAGAGLAFIALPGIGTTAAAAQAGGAPACPEKLAGQASLVCACSAEAASTGSVWGSGLYTADSSVCRAARHAGAVSAAGGEVRLRVSEGRDSYAASARNGIGASAWGSFSTSFAFDR